MDDKLMSGNRNIRLSIITVTRNARHDIFKTADSLFKQKFNNFEWIVVDGASTDGTIDIVNSFLRIGFDRLISEPDKGVYDAMNKGLRYASGEIVNFLNAGDIYADDQVLEVVNSVFTDEVDAVYGDSLMALPSGAQVMRRAGEIRTRIFKGMPISHQSLFVRRSVHIKFPFDISLKISADYKFISEIFMSNANLFYLRKIININTINENAISVRGRVASASEDYYIQTKILNIRKIPALKAFLKKRLNTEAVRFIQKWPSWLLKILPRKIRNKIY